MFKKSLQNTLHLPFILLCYSTCLYSYTYTGTCNFKEIFDTVINFKVPACTLHKKLWKNSFMLGLMAWYICHPSPRGSKWIKSANCHRKTIKKKIFFDRAK